MAADVGDARGIVRVVDGVPRGAGAAREELFDALRLRELDQIEEMALGGVFIAVEELPAKTVAAVDDARGGAVDENAGLRRRAEHRLKQILRAALRAPRVRLMQLARDRGREAREAMLEQIVVRAGAHQLHRRLLADRAGDDEKRHVEARQPRS